jgi:hypothetical protein
MCDTHRRVDPRDDGAVLLLQRLLADPAHPGKATTVRVYKPMCDLEKESSTRFKRNSPYVVTESADQCQT